MLSNLSRQIHKWYAKKCKILSHIKQQFDQISKSYFHADEVSDILNKEIHAHKIILILFSQGFLITNQNLYVQYYGIQTQQLQIKFIMDSGRSSRVQTPDNSQFRKTISQSRASTAFRTTNRSAKPHWGNRFVRDFNDLTYDIKYDLIKGKAELDQSKMKKNEVKRSERISSATIDSSRRGRKGISADKYENIIKFMKKNKRANPEQYMMVEEPKYSTLKSQGLCKFEFEKTIIGKMTHKSNHHMCFGYQTERSQNMNKIWYNNSEELDFHKMKRTQKRNKIQQCHDFASYPERRVFQPREELDKFYDTANSKKKTNPATIKETVKINRITGRKDPKLPPGTNLQYNQYDAKYKVMSKSPDYSIKNTKRQLVFGRQVISSERGCYR